MFWDKIIELCNRDGISPSKLCETLNFSNATATKWKNGATPHDSTVKKIANYFKVSVNYLVDKTSMQDNLEGGSWCGGMEEIKEDSLALNYGESPTKYKIKELIDTVLENTDNEEELNALKIVLEKFAK